MRARGVNEAYCKRGYLEFGISVPSPCPSPLLIKGLCGNHIQKRNGTRGGRGEPGIKQGEIAGAVENLCPLIEETIYGCRENTEIT